MSNSDYKSVEYIEYRIRVIDSMLDIGHWTIGDQHAFTESEIAHMHKSRANLINELKSAEVDA